MTIGPHEIPRGVSNTIMGSQPVYLIPLHRAPATKIRHSFGNLVQCSFDEGSLGRHRERGKMLVGPLGDPLVHGHADAFGAEP
jgi:hypothetical protein